MTPTEKQYIEKLEELINAWKKYEKYCAVIIGLELEAGKLSQQIEAEEKTVSDKEIRKAFIECNKISPNNCWQAWREAIKWYKKLLNNQDNG